MFLLQNGMSKTVLFIWYILSHGKEIEIIFHIPTGCSLYQLFTRPYCFVLYTELSTSTFEGRSHYSSCLVSLICSLARKWVLWIQEDQNTKFICIGISPSCNKSIQPETRNGYLLNTRHFVYFLLTLVFLDN